MRAREKAEVWEKRVEELARSGMSLKAYPAKIGVNANTLSGWRWKLRRKAKAELVSGDDAGTDEHGFTDMTSQLAAALTGEAGVIVQSGRIAPKGASAQCPRPGSRTTRAVMGAASSGA